MRTFFIIALLGLISCSGLAQPGLNSSQHSLVRQVSVSGQGEAEVEADMARVHLTAEAQSQTSAQAKSIVDDRVNQVIRILEKVGLRQEDLTAGQISISPRYNYRNNQQEFIGYFTNRSIQVEIADLEMLNAFLDAALEQKIDGINQIEYRTSREAEAKARARELAIQDSKEKARLLAEAYGVELGDVISINYQSSYATPVMMEASLIRAQSFAADSAGQYIPDQLSFTDNIQVIFELKAD